MYKLIAIDLDDTLLTHDLIVTEGTKAAIFEAIKREVTVTLATGRMYASAEQIAKQIQLNVPLITYQGALVKNLLDGKILYERVVPQHVAEYVFNYAEQNGYHLQAYYDDVLYAKEDNQKIKDYARASNVPYVIEPDFAALASKPQTKLLIYEDPETLDHIAEQLKQAVGGQVHITKSKPYFLEIMHPEGTKGHALQYMACYVGCKMSETIALGDSWNDREMLEMAGLGVAMENAVPQLKEIADFITLSNNDEGVKHVIERFVLNADS